MSDLRNNRFGQFFSECHLALQRYVQRFVGSKERADEIVQEAFSPDVRAGRSRADSEGVSVYDRA